MEVGAKGRHGGAQGQGDEEESGIPDLRLRGTGALSAGSPAKMSASFQEGYETYPGGVSREASFGGEYPHRHEGFKHQPVRPCILIIRRLDVLMYTLGLRS